MIRKIASLLMHGIVACAVTTMPVSARTPSNDVGAYIKEQQALDKKPNRLIDEKSPYLLQHAFNPVDWYPWGEVAFEKARREGKPIFLSVGYSTCHWCHVMEHESFENPKIAALLNSGFVAIKVDREERPDVDGIYMLATQALSGHGGWPMTVFLTPDLKPFYAGTYFPPESRGGMPGLPDVLLAVQRAWSGDRERVLLSATGITEFLAQHAAPGHGGAMPDARLLDRARAGFAEEYDTTRGGFGTAPKFPRPAALNFLLREHARAGNAQALSMTLGTLRAMAAGGIRDHLGGGFHRYSTDARWLVPHFEKMLYDQAQLAVAYLEAYQVSGDETLAAVARDTLDYVLRDLRDADGALLSAEDADSPLPENPERHGEGAFYVWSAKELATVLGQEAELFGYACGVKAGGNVSADPHGEFFGRNILYRAHTAEEAATQFRLTPAVIDARLARARATLLERRSLRPRPHRDDKIVTAWNGLMITALARAATVLDEPRYRVAAVHAADFLHGTVFDVRTGELRRRYRDGDAAVLGQLDDYAFLVQGLLDLYEADFDTRWLDWAVQLTEKQLALFWDEHSGGFFETSGRDSSILLRMKTGQDMAEPAGNSVAALNLLRLAQILDRAEWAEKAGKTMAAFTGQLSSAPTASPQMLVALQYQLEPPRQIVIAGTPGAADTRAMLRQVQRRFLPNKILLLADGGAGQQWLGRRLEFMQAVHPLGSAATAYLCRNYVCKRPTAELGVLVKQLGGD